MRFKSVFAASFRNLIDEKVDTDAKNIFLVGENGQGKTNFLESLYFCSYASSFRGAKDAALMRDGAKSCAVIADVADGDAPQKLCIKIENGVKSALLDGKTVDDRKSLLSIIPCVVFCHEDLSFVAGTTERRRWFFDQNRCLYDMAYIEDLRRYRKILKMRNAALKDFSHANNSIIDALDPQLADYGLRLVEKRQEEAHKFSGVFAPVYESVAGIGGISVSHTSSWKGLSSDEVIQKLKNDRPREIKMGVSLSGPHRDRYEFLRDKKNFVETASTGQLRLLALLLRVSQSIRYRDMTGATPVFLFDDVLLELDGERRRSFLKTLPDYEQAFFTFLPDEPFATYEKDDVMIYDVKSGALALREGA